MDVLKYAKKFEDAVIENGRFRMLLTVLIVPALFMLSSKLLDDDILVVWLLMWLATYAAVLIVGLVYGVSKDSKRVEIIKTVLTLVTPLAWGSMLAVAYYFSYLLIFDRENIFPI